MDGERVTARSMAITVVTQVHLYLRQLSKRLFLSTLDLCDVNTCYKSKVWDANDVYMVECRAYMSMRCVFVWYLWCAMCLICLWCVWRKCSEFSLYNTCDEYKVCDVWCILWCVSVSVCLFQVPTMCDVCSVTINCDVCECVMSVKQELSRVL